MAAQPDRRIVVGVDGSPSSLDALRWAAKQARATGAWLDAVIAWEAPPSFGAAPSLGYVPAFEGVPPFDLSEAARATIDAAIKEALGPHAGLRVEPAVVQGHAVATLIARSEGAELLVIGSRGRGGFTGLLLGSVSANVIGRAWCPVTVVRHFEAETPAA